MSQLHLLDGTFELFRAHFGAPSRTSPEGVEVGATHGLLSSTLALLSMEGVTHVGAAFDTVIESFRNQIFAGYKTGEGVPSELRAQFELAEEGMRCMGITVWSMVEQEADDGLAAAAVKFAPEVERVVIMSPDKDLAQLYGNPKIVGYDRRKSSFVDADEVRRKFGVAAESIPDYLALVGDTADGIPGLSGWGAKSAASLLSCYGQIEVIPDSALDWKPKVRGAEKLAATLCTHRDTALLYRELATLRTDAEIPQALEDLRWRGAHRGRFIKFCERLGFGKLKDRPHRWQD